MRTLNRTLVVLIWAIAVALVLVAISQTGWALDVNPDGIAEDYSNPIQPLVRIAAALTVMVTGTKLIQAGFRFITERVLDRSVRASVN